ncbi:SprT-like family [Musa troglodytarum]|uniref:SprT-like family n=1 Tax=Musa troglodytarum TaxID=320322 RepID=A0A9E7F352_9LILI|nr:SprT-like family [Musa troglodytarum]
MAQVDIKLLSRPRSRKAHERTSGSEFLKVERFLERPRRPLPPRSPFSASMDSRGVEAGVNSPDGRRPDIYELFCHYNALYFRDALGACALSWASSSPHTSYAAYCHYYDGGGCEIHLSKPLLKTCPASDLKNVLLHEMIHAFLWIEYNNKDHSDHGPSFQDMMNSINSNSVIDPQRPTGGYNITIDHGFQKDHNADGVHQWICELCGKVILSTTNRGPSADDCIENVGPDVFCDNPLCHWHSHNKQCSGRYFICGPPECYGDKTSSRGKQECHENRTERLPNLAGQTKQRLHKIGQKKDKHNGQKNNLAKYLLPSEMQCAVAAGGRKRRKKCASKKHVSTRSKRRKMARRDNKCTVVIEWLGLFEDEEAEDDSEPLMGCSRDDKKPDFEQERHRTSDFEQ